MKFILGEKRGACRVGRECTHTIYRTRGKQIWAWRVNAKELSWENQTWRSEILGSVLSDYFSIFENYVFVISQWRRKVWHQSLCCTEHLPAVSFRSLCWGWDLSTENIWSSLFLSSMKIVEDSACPREFVCYKQAEPHVGWKRRQIIQFVHGQTAVGAKSFLLFTVLFGRDSHTFSCHCQCLQFPALRWVMCYF